MTADTQAPPDVAARRNIETLEALNRKARELAYGIDALDWDRPVDRSKFWSPPEISPLCHLPSFKRLEERHQIRYNQLFAVGVCEQFVWFEQHLAVPVLRLLIDRTPDMPPLLKDALEIFIEEEHKHSEMFWRMCEKAEPSWYPERRFYLFNTTGLQNFALGLMLRYPKALLMWIWAVIFFEERTVDYCRQYWKAKRKTPDLIDPSFTELHEYHFKDEGRHFQLDQHLLTWLYDPEARWKKRVAGRSFYRLMKAYTSPRRTSLRVIDVLEREFPELKAELGPALREELPLLASSKSFHEAAFSRKAVGRSMELFAQYPELDRIWELFVVENKEGSVVA
jgi:hypothetical protein